jgi:hypothetical protein
LFSRIRSAVNTTTVRSSPKSAVERIRPGRERTIASNVILPDRQRKRGKNRRIKNKIADRSA